MSNLTVWKVYTFKKVLERKHRPLSTIIEITKIKVNIKQNNYLIIHLVINRSDVTK